MAKAMLPASLLPFFSYVGAENKGGLGKREAEEGDGGDKS